MKGIGFMVEHNTNDIESGVIQKVLTLKDDTKIMKLKVKHLFYIKRHNT
jgi:hypothetical protein